MVNIALVDDDESCVRLLEEYLHQYEKERNIGFLITRFKDGDSIVANYKAEFDIILMDVQMQFMDGMSAAKEIRRNDSEVIIIFITSLRQYAIQGYAVEALDYLVKPISYFVFSERLGRAIAKLRMRSRKNIVVNIRGGMLRIDLADILYIESQGHTLIFHTISGLYESSGTMKELEGRLANSNFSRGNKGYLINLAHVDGVQDGCAIVQGDKLALSRSRKTQFMEELTDYWSEVK